MATGQDIVINGEETESEDERLPLIPAERENKLKQISKILLQNKLFIGIVLGQVLSLLKSGSSVFSQILQSSPPGPFHAPNSQYFLVNFIITLIFTINLARKPKLFTKALLYRGILYLPIAILDIEAAYLILLSFQYTTLTSVNLMQSFVIVCTAIFSVVFLSISYTIQHLMGIAFAIIGIVVLLFVDVNGDNPYGVLIGTSDRRLIGDGLVLLASLFYGITNTSSEVLCRKYGVAEFLGIHQLFSAIILGIQVCILERKALLEVEWNTRLVLFLSAYTVNSILVVVMLLSLIKLSGATAVNISLITSNFYNLVLGSLVFNYRFSWLYILGLCTLITGLILFHIKPTGELKWFGVTSWLRIWREKRRSKYV
ncbi:hypothetical protein LOD99_2712 [Oopsacas minuta]|uniref:Uncharacterized protein n=1 Tax=Oopsacas minuta TaxID=111878 RepID=A0AAV7K1K1_9METZ|nr:hypothetical protein LOD99_2712 [Oopsacas minuta]